MRFKLIFFNYYEVNNTEIYFTYKSLDIILSITPKEGHISGGNIVQIGGNFQILDGQIFQLFFGSYESTVFTMDSIFQITATTPPGTIEETVAVKIVYGAETYITEGVTFRYKNYFQITSISPTTGPSRGETVVKIQYNGTISEEIYCKFGDQLAIPIICKFLIIIDLNFVE